MKSKKERIIETGSSLFWQNGILNTSMEQIAETVPVSKMTIYNYFQSKEGLLEQVVDRLLANWDDRFRRMIGEADDAISALKNMARFWEVEPYSEVFMKDLMEYYPVLAQKMFSYSKEHIIPEAEKLIFRGQQSGQLRKDVSPHVLMVFMLGLKEVFARPEIFAPFEDLHSVGEQITSIIYYGIINPEWRERLAGKQKLD
ncbi:MAG: transcriptional regulator-like protein [Paenibacillus sp.]|nr:transcriptional regulator-like protein [Paenibacillus sp.]